MSDYEKITDTKVIDLIQGLIQTKTLVKVAVPKGDYGQLTVIIATRGDGAEMYFQIDPPEGLQAVIAQSTSAMLHFEFSNQERLPHRFDAAIKEVNKEFWLRFPEHIQRLQLRNNFRIKAPANAHASVLIEKARVKMIVDNISLGGLYCHCPNAVRDAIAMDTKLENMELVFTFGHECRLVNVGSAIVRRVEGRTRSGHFGLAFEFLSITLNAKKNLTQVIYDLQRDFLKNRLR